MTPEQRARMERNKAMALEKKRKRSSLGAKQPSISSFFQKHSQSSQDKSSSEPVLSAKSPAVPESRATEPIRVVVKEKAAPKLDIPAASPKFAIKQHLSSADDSQNTPEDSPQQEEPVTKVPEDNHDIDIIQPSKRKRTSKKIKYAVSDDESDEEPIRKPSKKPLKRRLNRGSDSSEDEYVPDEADKAMLLEEDDFSMDDAVIESEIEELEEDPTPKKKISSKRKAVSPAQTPTVKKTTLSALSNLSYKSPSQTPKRSNFLSQSSKSQSPSSSTPDRHDWLEDIRDATGKRPGEPGYDPTTLLIPKEAKFTPFEQQYWDIKRNYWDTILFFKKGKFYELYENDAEIGHREFDLKITDRVNMKMAGVPEATFTEWASRFLGKGYKVAKADERENSVAKAMRERKSGVSGKKIIDRKLTKVLTQGTLMGDFLIGDLSTYIMSIKENEETLQYGVCFADTGTAEFNICCIQDDQSRTQIETLLVQIKPREIVYEAGNLSKDTLQLLNVIVGGADKNILKSGEESGCFWDKIQTARLLELNGYFKDQTGKGTKFPAVVEEMINSDDELGVSALGGLVSYFQTLLIDESLLPQGSFTIYDPLRSGGSLLLDGQTLQNLDILEASDGGQRGSLLHLLCRCSSPFGKRLFRKWLCHPLRDVGQIEERLQAIEDLDTIPDLKGSVQAMITGVCDIERMIARVHTGSCKLQDFLRLLDDFDKIFLAVQDLQSSVEKCKSQRLRRLLTVGSLFPNLSEPLKHFEQAFDRHEVRKEGKIIPKRGVYNEYDAAANSIDQIEHTFSKVLSHARSELRLPKLSFYSPKNTKEPYQIPVPNASQKRVPSSWILKSKTKTMQRYWTPETPDLVQTLTENKETVSQLLKEMYSVTLKRFDDDHDLWSTAVSCLAELDCILSLHEAKDSMGEPMCRPTFVDSEGTSPIFDVQGLRHPCLVEAEAVVDYIANDTKLGGEGNPAVIVLTGPNMGGKSTLLRQTCVATIMAQLGCWVPAESLTMSVVDRIFTRIGANDNIIAGLSTFMVELKETANILNQATKDSLVILDELGRGTSTFDGYSIAYSVLSNLADKLQCRALFATHYHLLTEEFEHHPKIAMMRMGCVIDDSRYIPVVV